MIEPGFIYFAMGKINEPRLDAKQRYPNCVDKRFTGDL